MTGSRHSPSATAISRDVDKALGEFRAIVGPDFVHVGAATARYARSTTGLERRVPGVVLPATEEEVSAVVRTAAKYRAQLYPVSTGRNWGYGCGTPVTDGCVVVDLSRMTRINVDERLAIATLEPGVTQGRLWEHLREKRLPFMVPATGAGPTTSIVGNALERGYGITPYGDHFGAVTSVRAVLPNGERFQPALAELGGGSADRVHKWGIGPYLDGLFCQGSFGIVTEMTIALARRPSVVEAFLFELDSDSDLDPIVDAVRDLLQTAGGTIGAINLLNRRRLLSMTAPYPAGRPPTSVLGRETVDALGAQLGLPQWVGFGGIYGDAPMVRAVRRLVRNHLARHCRRLLFFSEGRAAVANKLARFVPGHLGRQLQLRAGKLRELLDILGGRPRETALQLAYWRSGLSPAPGLDLDPSRDGCGLIWYAPLVPMLPEAVREFVDLIEQTCPRFGIEPLITLTSVSRGAFDSTVPILFDLSNNAAAAQDCYERLLHEGQRHGFLPYRLATHAMPFFAKERATPYWQMINAVKRALDPDEIISPGRYSGASGAP